MFYPNKGIKWGRVFLSCNWNELSNALYNNIKVVVLDDDTEKYRRIGCNIMSMLLPPYEAIDAECNQQFELAGQIYQDYILRSENALAPIANIIAATYVEKDILIFVPPDEAKSLSFINVLAETLYSVYGIPCATLSDPTSNPFYDDTNLYTLSNRVELMYACNIISLDTLCDCHPYTDLNPIIFPRLVYDLGYPNLEGMHPNQIQAYFNTMVFSRKDQRIELFKQDVNEMKNMIFPFVELRDFVRQQPEDAVK
jgi:hypothetical protein